MWDLSDYIVIILAILGFIFPGQLIASIRSEETEQSNKYKIISSLLFSVILFLIGVFLNS